MKGAFYSAPALDAPLRKGYSLPSGVREGGRMQTRPVLVQVERRAEEVRCPGEIWGDVRRVLVVRNDPLDSLVLALPALAALRDAYPAAWIGVLARPRTSPLLALVPSVDETVEDPGDGDVLVARLAAFRADLLVSMSPGSRVPWAAAKARVKHRLGPAHRVYSPLFERCVNDPAASVGRHEVELALSYAHRAGARPGPARFPVALSGEARERAAEWAGEHGVRPPFLVLRPESGRACPSWPQDYFVRLATLLRGEGCEVVFSVGPAGGEVARLLDAAEISVRRIPRFTGDLATLSALLGMSSLTIGNSTGCLHLAAALGTPTLAFLAPWPSCGPARWGPYSPDGWCVVPEPAEGHAGRWRESRPRGPGPLAEVSPAVALSCALTILDGRTPSTDAGAAV